MLIKVTQAQAKLQILATPIGNLNEITYRAIDALKKCKFILCEDTRVVSKLLSKFNIHGKQLISYQKFNENEKLDLALKKIKLGKTILCTDAGYPCISDPGYLLVNKCYENNIAIEVINGPCSLIHSIVASGFNLSNFYFNGFLPPTSLQRKNKLLDLKKINVPIIFFESVHRIKKTLNDIYEIFNDPQIVVCRELTKLNETIYRGKYNEIINDIVEKGEFVIVSYNNVVNNQSQYSNSQIINRVKEILKNNKVNLKYACKLLSKEIKIKSSEIYNLIIKSK